MLQQGHLFFGLWSGCPQRGQEPREKAGTTGFHRKTMKITWRRKCISLCNFFHHAPLLKSHGDMKVVALKLHHPNDRKGTALLVFYWLLT